MRVLTFQSTPAAFLAAVIAASSLTGLSDSAAVAKPPRSGVSALRAPDQRSVTGNGQEVVTDSTQELTIILRLKPVQSPLPAARPQPQSLPQPVTPTTRAPQQKKPVASQPQTLKRPRDLQIPVLPKIQTTPKASSQPKATIDSSKEWVVVPVFPRVVATPAKSRPAVPAAKPSGNADVNRTGRTAAEPSGDPAVTFLTAPPADPKIQIVQRISGPVLPAPEGESQESPKSRYAPSVAVLPAMHDALNDRLRNDGFLIGLAGHSPVAFSKQGALKPGIEQFSVMHRGVIYYLQNATEKAMFREKPESYAPALQGYDLMTLHEQGRMTSGKIEIWAEHRGRLYLFQTSENRKRFLANAEQFSKIPEMTLHRTKSP